jgi:5'(3')-deoxyribonucleotidase
MNMKNRTIRVGIDIDGVLRDFVKKTMELSRLEGLDFSRPKDYGYINTLEIDGKPLRNKIWGEWQQEIFEDSPIISFAKKGYDNFVNDDQFEVYIVSAQRKGTEHHTDKWLEKNGFNKHQNNIYTFKKREAPCQILIDDKPENVQDYKDNLREGYLVECSYNQDSRLQPKVRNLNEAYNQIKEKYGH